MKIIVFLLSAIITSAISLAAGPGEGGGGFGYKNSIHLLESSQEELLDSLAVYDQKCFSEILKIKKLPHDVDIESLRRIIKNTKRKYFKSVKRRTATGELQPLNFNYGMDKNGPYIEALQLYFSAFAAISPEDAYLKTDQVERMLLHEAAHIFSYTEEEAERFAGTLQKLSVYKTTEEKNISIYNDPRRGTSAEAEMLSEYFSCEEFGPKSIVLH